MYRGKEILLLVEVPHVAPQCRTAPADRRSRSEVLPKTKGARPSVARRCAPLPALPTLLLSISISRASPKTLPSPPPSPPPGHTPRFCRRLSFPLACGSRPRHRAMQPSLLAQHIRRRQPDGRTPKRQRSSSPSPPTAVLLSRSLLSRIGPPPQPLPCLRL